MRPNVKLDKLETLLGAGKPRCPTRMPLFWPTSVDPERRPLPAAGRQSAEAQGSRPSTPCWRSLMGLAARLPVLMIFEDAHWIDPTSLELLERIIERVQGLPVLLIVASRPEFAPPWTGRPHVTVHRSRYLAVTGGQR